jgi:hypothetical protein
MGILFSAQPDYIREGDFATVAEVKWVVSRFLV